MSKLDRVLSARKLPLRHTRDPRSQSVDTMHLQKGILNQEADPDDSEPSHHRILVERTHFKCVTIDPEIYDIDDLCFPPILLEILPPFPIGSWNCGRIGRTVDNRHRHFI